MNDILKTNTPQFETEMLDVIKLFYSIDSVPCKICHSQSLIGDRLTNICVIEDITEVNEIVLDKKWDTLMTTRYLKRYAKLSVYNCLKKFSGQSMPWGALTGIRPTKLAYEVMSRDHLQWQKVFSEVFDVSDEKIDLVNNILKEQSGLRIVDDNFIDLYIGIPFCVSRCSYCSFTSGEIDKLHKYVEPYVNKLCMEIDRTLQLIRDNNLQIINVYFGGGTPTSLSCEQLKKILQHLDVKPREYCIEAGRPDTIDEEKLDLFQEYGVNRISINPQTFNQRILDKVGRKHTVKDIYNKFQLARQYNFIINMDLIAGLPSETYEEFCYSVDETIKLHPDNITVHTLAIKRGSLLRNAEESNYSEENNVNEMVRYSHTRLYQEGYAPYYLYRQKYMKDNLENVGFCRNHTPSLYNIDIMEETRSIVACGTNAISKRVFSEENRIERCANPKDVITYIDRLEEFIERKERLFRRK